MKKKLIAIAVFLVVLVTTGCIFYYFNYEDKETSLTISEKRWIEQNKATRVNFEVLNDIPLFGMNGSGVIFQFITDFEDATGLDFNKIPYLKGNQPTGTSLRIRLLNNEEQLGSKDLFIASDDYVLASTRSEEISRIADLKDRQIGVLSSDVGEATYYLKSGTNLEVISYEDIGELRSALDDGDIDYMMLPKITYLEQIIKTEELSINYIFTDISRKLVLTLSDEDTKLNEIVAKYFEKWKKTYYVQAYNKAYLNYFVEQNKINDKTKAELLSKTYVYGYVENAPYEVTMDESVVGIAGEYIARMSRLTGIDFTYKKYQNKEELRSAIEKGEVDLYFNDNDMTNNLYMPTVSTFVEEYVVLGKPSLDQVVSSFESLKGQSVNMVTNNSVYSYFKNNSRASIQEVDSIQKLTANDHLIVVDKEVYLYHQHGVFADYQILYQDTITNNYHFMVKKEHTSFYQLFNHIINTNSYYRYRNSGLNSLHVSLMDRTTFEEFYLIVLGVILLPLLIIVAIYLYIRKKQKRTAVKKEDRRKYTDMLTSLKNRNYLNLNMEAWDESRVYPQAIVIVDLNNVKYVNDNYGMEAGDELIVKAAGILVNTQLENSEIIRTDGNEFLIYLVGYSEQQISTYTKKLNKELKELPHGFGASIGFSMIMDDIKMIDDAINEATLEMRTHKEEYK